MKCINIKRFHFHSFQRPPDVDLESDPALISTVSRNSAFDVQLSAPNLNTNPLSGFFLKLGRTFLQH